jgi:hypothetical protein
MHFVHQYGCLLLHVTLTSQDLHLSERFGNCRIHILIVLWLSYDWLQVKGVLPRFTIQIENKNKGYMVYGWAKIEADTTSARFLY